MTRRPGQQDDKHHHHCLVRRCLAIVLRRVADDGSPESKEGSAEVSRRRTKTRRPSTISAEERRGDEGPGPPEETGIADGSVTFGELVRENSECYWNPCLVQSVNNLEYKGYMTPATLLIAGTEYSLEVVRSAWARRVLRPPRGFDILMLGDLESIEMSIVSQTHFAPLPEALCKVVYDLTSEGTIATMTVITDRLKVAFPEIVVPEHGILYRTLGSLIRERKLYHTGHGYSVVTPETYRLLAVSPPLERQMLLTNEEAIVRLHGTAVTLDTEESEVCRSACTQTNQKDIWSSVERIIAPSKQGSSDQKIGRLKRSHSLRLLRGKEKEKLIRSNSFRSPTTSPFLNRESRSDPENHENIKKEKSSMFSKLFRRGRTDKGSPKAPKCASFSAQFPPLEWSDPDFVHFHSRATQTLDRDVVMKSKTRSSSLNRMSNRERHSLHLSSTPVGTPWITTNSNNNHAADIYHYRSSSLPRKSSPSPNREGVRNHSTRKSPKSSRPQHQHEPQCRVPVTAKPRARYQSPFVPVVSPSNNRNLLKPGERYSDANTLQTSNVLPYRPLSFSSIPPATLKQTSTPSSFRLSAPPSVTAPTWRTTLLPPTSEQKLAVREPLKKPPIVVLPQRPVAREVASVLPSTAATTTTTTTTLQPRIIETESKKIVGSPTNVSSTREVHLGGTVDVQISVEPKISTQIKKGVLNTDLDSDVNKDLLKIATTWNHSISNKSPVGKAGIMNSGMNPTVTTTTSITTSLSHKGLKKEGQKMTSVEIPQKDLDIVTNSSGQTVKKSSLIDCAEKCNLLNDLEENKLHLEPRSKLADAKAAFFAESPTPSQQLMKDDSGFSSSASTSRPMSVSPC